MDNPIWLKNFDFFVAKKIRLGIFVKKRKHLWKIQPVIQCRVRTPVF